MSKARKSRRTKRDKSQVTGSGYSPEERAILIDAGKDPAKVHPKGTIRALEPLTPQRRAHVTAVNTIARAAMVAPVHYALTGLTGDAQAGWGIYSEMWDRAQPSASMSYGDRSSKPSRDELRDPAWLEAATALRHFEGKLGRRVANRADEYMRLKETLAVNALLLAMLETVGCRMLKVAHEER